MKNHAQAGTLDWIGLRPARKETMQVVQSAEINEAGLIGDRHPSPGKRAVTLIQAEHFPVIAALSQLEDVTPDLLRRNLVVSGINLSALRHHEITVGNAVLLIAGPCAPCSRMESILGHGGYNAMRGHGGWCAEVVTPGHVTRGDAVAPVSQ